MNRNKIIARILAGICVTNVVMMSPVNSQLVKADTISYSDNMNVNSNIIKYEDFSKTKTESDANFKLFYENEIRPESWQLRKWSGAASTGANKPYGKVVSDSISKGGKYFEVAFNKSVGFFQPDDFINIAPNENYNLNFKLKTTGITASEPLMVRAEYYDSKGTVVERKDLITLSGNNDWKEYNSNIGTTKDAAVKMKIIFVFGRVAANSVGASGSFAVDYMSIKAQDSKLEKVDFTNKNVNIGIGNSSKIDVTTYPSYSTEKYTLKSSDESIVKVENNIVYGLKVGAATITAISESNKILGSFNVNVNYIDVAMYNKVLDSISETLVPNSIIDKKDTQMMGIIESMVSSGEKSWTTMNKTTGNTSGLWADTKSTTSSAQVTTQFNRLYDMAVAYAMEGSKLKGNEELLKDIIYGLEWMKINRYDGKKWYDNWWDWEVGAPQKLNSILILLRNNISSEEILKYTDIIDNYVKDPTMISKGRYPSVGANRSDMCKVIIYSGLLSKNEDRIKLGVEKLDPLFKYVEDIIAESGKKIDGYYKDGSWIEHSTIPYAGSYGGVLIGGIGELAHVLNGTSFEIPKEKQKVIYDVLLKSFDPLMYKGNMMDMVSGRSVSRESEKESGSGFGLMRRILAFYTETAPQEYKEKFKSIVKGWITSNDARDIIATSNNIQFTAQVKELMKEENLKARGELLGNFMFPNMDRVVHRTPNFVFGLSMYSSRVSNYESLNGENLKGYHTSDGMTYLYNGDSEQYSNDFWPTVDAKRLAGTTVDTKDIFKDVAGVKYGPGETTNSNRDWVGGASLLGYGVSGMYLDNKRTNPKKDLGMDLEAKKSYFMFDDEIVALGSGITSTKDNGVETIVENRLINKDLDKIYVDGKEISNTIDNETKIDNSKWIYLEGNKSNSSIGYYFPSSDSLKVKRDTRSGSWKDINNGQSAELKTNTFFTMWKEHGAKPSNDTYEYVLLPGKTKEQVEAYSNKADVKILSNNEDVQSVREANKNIIAANFWNDKVVELKEAGIKVNTRASVIFKETDGKLDIAVSDPTMKNQGEITIELDKTIKNIISKDENIKIENVNGKTIIHVNVKGSSGQSYKAEFELF